MGATITTQRYKNSEHHKIKCHTKSGFQVNPMRCMVESCGYCGACVAVCPNKLLELARNELILDEGCKNCGRCIIVCPLGALIPEDDS